MSKLFWLSGARILEYLALSACMTTNVVIGLLPTLVYATNILFCFVFVFHINKASPSFLFEIPLVIDFDHACVNVHWQ